MVVVKIADGLGNQLFNYACGYAVAKKNGETLKLDTSDCDNSQLRNFELDNFKLDDYERESFPNNTIWQKIYKRVRRNSMYSVTLEKESYFFDERVFKPKTIRNRYLDGYWQNYRYFEFCKKDIKRQYQPAYKQTEYTKKLIRKFSSASICAIHIRTGDIQALPLAYFQKAIELMKSLIPDVCYVIFSNDETFAKKYMEELSEENMEMIGSFGIYTDIDQFFLLSACQNQIISPSSFSWWAAYLNAYDNKIIVAPDIGKNSLNLYPDDWKLLK